MIWLPLRRQGGYLVPVGLTFRDPLAIFTIKLLPQSSPHYSWRFVAKSRSRVARRACGAARLRGVLEQYVEGVSGEPASRRRVVAANPRLQQKRSWIMRA